MCGFESGQNAGLDSAVNNTMQLTQKRMSVSAEAGLQISDSEV